MKPIIVVDFDGTITRPPLMYFKLYNNICDQYGGRKLQECETHNIRELSPHEIFTYLGISRWMIPFLVRRMKSEISSHVTDLPLIENMKDVLRDLRDAGYKMSIISTNSEKNIRSYLKFNSMEYFTHIQCDTSIFHKHRSLLIYLKKNDLNPKEILYVGDEVRDIRSCKQVGVPIVSVTWGLHSRDSLEKWNPDHIIDDPRELLDVVKERSTGLDRYYL